MTRLASVRRLRVLARRTSFVVRPRANAATLSLLALGSESMPRHAMHRSRTPGSCDGGCESRCTQRLPALCCRPRPRLRLWPRQCRGSPRRRPDLPWALLRRLLEANTPRTRPSSRCNADMRFPKVSQRTGCRGLLADNAWPTQHADVQLGAAAMRTGSVPHAGKPSPKDCEQSVLS